MVIVQVIRRIALLNADLRNPNTEMLVLTACQEAYRAGVIEMQEPIKIWEDVAGEDPDMV
jgi:hypothetical protein